MHYIKRFQVVPIFVNCIPFRVKFSLLDIREMVSSLMTSQGSQLLPLPWIISYTLAVSLLMWNSGCSLICLLS